MIFQAIDVKWNERNVTSSSQLDMQLQLRPACCVISGTCCLCSECGSMLDIITVIFFRHSMLWKRHWLTFANWGNATRKHNKFDCSIGLQLINFILTCMKKIKRNTATVFNVLFHTAIDHTRIVAVCISDQQLFLKIQPKRYRKIGTNVVMMP